MHKTAVLKLLKVTMLAAALRDPGDFTLNASTQFSGPRGRLVTVVRQ